MRAFSAQRFSALTLLLALSACSAAQSNPYAGAAVGGASGAAIGAGTGAIIGASIKNGAVGDSALLGGAIGLPIGILLGVAYTNSTQSSDIADNAEELKANHERLLAQEREIEYLRNEIRDDSSSRMVNPDRERIEHQYLGPSLGNPRR